MGFNLKTAKPINQKARFNLATAKPLAQEQETPMANYATAAQEAITPYSEAIGRRIGAFGKGAVRGASLNTLGRSQSQDLGLEGSVFQPEEEKTFGKAGEFAGSIVPFMAAEVTGGASLGTGAALRGAGKFGQAIARGTGTGLALGGAEQVAEKGIGGVLRTPLSSANEAAKPAMGFAALAAGGQGLGYLRKLFGEKFTDSISNYFFNTDTGVAKKLARKGEPSLASQAMDFKGFAKDNPLSGFKSQKEVLEKARKELGILQGEGRAIIEGVDAEAKRPFTPVADFQGQNFPSKKPGKYVGMEYQDPRVGTIGHFEETGLRTQGKPFMKGKGEGLFQPDEVASGRTPYGQEVKAKRMEEYAKRAIDIQKVASELDPIMERYSRVGGKTGPSKTIGKIKADFLKSNPKVTSLEDAISVKSTLDRIVNDAYEKKLIDVTDRDMVYETLANGIRKQAYKLSPEIGQNFDKQSLLHDVIKSLEPTQPISGKLPQFGGNWIRMMVNPLVNNRFALGSATALKKTIGSPSTRVAPATRRFIGASSANYLTPYDDKE